MNPNNMDMAAIEAFMKQQKAMATLPPYDASSEPTFAEWCGHKIATSKLVYGLSYVDKKYTFAKRAVGNFIVKYQWFVGTMAAAGLATYIVMQEPSAPAEPEVVESPLELPTLPEYEEEKDLFSIDGLMSMKSKITKSLFD